MAETLAQILKEGPEGSQVLVLIGKGHILYNLGLPRLTRIRRDHSYKSILPVPNDYPVRNLDAKMGDFLWITEESGTRHPPRLGVTLRPHSSGEGLEILSIIPGSAAEKAGLKGGDILLKIDDVAILSIEALPQIFSQKKGTYLLQIKRGESVFQEKISLTP
jgi:membrane-associated protease RseP (regulator of RpoE activity)